MTLPLPQEGSDRPAQQGSGPANTDDSSHSSAPSAGEPAGESFRQQDGSGIREYLGKERQRLRAVEAVVTNQGSLLGSLQEHMGLLASSVTELDERLTERALPAAADPTSVEALIGYRPTPEQQMALFEALAAWQATIQPIEKNRTAAFRTRDREDGRGGQEVSYAYADLGAVLHQARSAGAHGIAVTCQTIRGSNPGELTIVALALHKGGGAISSGPWTPNTEGNRMANRNQNVGGAMTSARRLLIQNLMGIAAEEDSDFNDQSEQGRRGRGGAAASGRPGPATGGRSPRPAAPPAKPPAGWLPKAQLDAINSELADPAITPERFQELEAQLLAHKEAVVAMNLTRTG